MNANDLALVQAGIANFPETQVFWDQAQAGRFTLPRCQSCGKQHWFPRAFCPLCFSADVVWEDSAGTGTLFTYSRLQGPDGERVIAYVQLDDGPLMLTELVDVSGELAIGQAVQVTLVQAAPDLAPELRMPKFKLLA
jgi:hypothetical protein